MSATATGTLSSLAVGIGNATFTAGDGNDVLNVSVAASGDNATAAALQQAKTSMGDGNDQVSLVAQSILRITGDAGQDTVQLQHDWNHNPAATVTYDGVTYKEFTSSDNL